MDDDPPSTPTYRSMRTDVDPGGPIRISIPRALHDEAVFAQTRIDIAPSMVDLVLCMDCTGSMGQYIREAKDAASRIAHVLRHDHGLDLRVGFAPYRDHPPVEMTFASKRFPLSSAHDKLYEYLCGPEATAQGGGDGPEAVEMGLFEALHMKWRPGATKLCFLIGDAPPHGLGEARDDFPNGSPQGIDPIGVLDEMASKGIRVYALACEPSLSTTTDTGTAFWVAAALKTQGRAFAVAMPGSLGDTIIGAVLEEVDLTSLQEPVVAWVDAARRWNPDKAHDLEFLKATAYRLMVRDRTMADQLHAIQTTQLTTALLEAPTGMLVARSKTIQEAKDALLREMASPNAKAALRLTAMETIAKANVAVVVQKATITREQFDRVYHAARG